MFNQYASCYLLFSNSNWYAGCTIGTSRGWISLYVYEHWINKGTGLVQWHEHDTIQSGETHK